MMKRILIVLAASSSLLLVSNANACADHGYGAQRYSPFDSMTALNNMVAEQNRIDARAIDEERAQRNLAAKLTPATSTEPRDDSASNQQPADNPPSEAGTVDHNLFR